MDRRRRLVDPQTPPPSTRKPDANPNFSPFLDLSNFKTPTPNPSPSTIFFTASKNTPSSRSSIRRKPFTPSVPQSKAGRRLKALELERSKLARKAETRKAQTLLLFSRSVTVWLDFLLENPKECGCDIGAGFDGGRAWKRPKICEEGEVGLEMTAQKISELKNSLKDVCSLEDLKKRMERYISRKGCNEVLRIMSRLCKNIDEGRLKMKEHCPIATDLALKEKSTKVLMCYNLTWLRVGLHIVLGGDSLLIEEGKPDQEGLFLKLTIENQFYTHMHKARSYAYNKFVEGLYKPGFYEALGSIILKRFLLLVISLDKAKCESMLPIKYGVDGIDGGSPLLFIRHSHIKSSQHAVQEFLSGAMHGEGDLLSHLAILGCKLNYQQFPLVECDFRVRNLFEDLCDGIILSRAIHLLKNDASILAKLVIPPDSQKKRLQNCNIAMQYLKQAGVHLIDEDGIRIEAEDIVNGDKELTLSILWNMFVQLQVPLLVDRTLLVNEISKLRGSNVVLSNSQGNTELELLLSWLQAVCETQGIKIGNFSSIIEGMAFSCLINYYLRTEVCRYSLKENQAHRDDELIRDMVTVAIDRAHNISFISCVLNMLGNVPKVFQLCDMLDQDFFYDERSVVILLVFLSSRLINRKIGDELRYKVTRQNYRDTDLKPSIATQSPPFTNTGSSSNFQWKKLLEFVSPQKQSSGMGKESTASVIQTHLIVGKKFSDIQNAALLQGRASIVVQSNFRGFTERKKFRRIKMAACIVQSAVRAWLTVNSRSKLKTASLVLSCHEPPYGIYYSYLRFMFERHLFLTIRKSVILIQRAARAWFTQKMQRNHGAVLAFITHDSLIAAISVQSVIRGQNVQSRYVSKLATSDNQQGITPELEDCEHFCRAAVRIQSAWKKIIKRRLHIQKTVATITIQKHWRSWYLRKKFLCQVAASTVIQANIRCFMHKKVFIQHMFAAVKIQRFVRRQLAWKWLIGTSSLPYDRSNFGSCNMACSCQNSEVKILMDSILKVQRWWKQVLFMKSRIVSAILIQSFIRGWNTRRTTRKKLSSISTIQRWWRNVLLVKLRKKSAILIQTHVRGWIARRKAELERHNVVMIQSCWKGFIVRKHSGEQIADLRFRLQRTSVNVDDDKRLINKLVAALSELLGYKCVSDIRHACVTMNTATELSQKCCETLVSAGAIHTLLKQFHSLNRGIPDQEVLKHVISTLNNISSYPHLLQVLLDTPRAVQIIFQELLRSKSEVFFIAYEILKKICATPDGLKAIQKLHFHVRKLNDLVSKLERKFELQKRNDRLCTGKDDTGRRLRAATDLMRIISREH